MNNENKTLLLDLVKEQGIVDIINDMNDMSNVDFEEEYYELEEDFLDDFDYKYKGMRRIRGDLYRLTFEKNGEKIFFYISKEWDFDCGSFSFSQLQRLQDWINSGRSVNDMWNGDWTVNEIVKKIFKMTIKKIKLSFRGDFKKLGMININKYIKKYSKEMGKDNSLVFRTNMKYMGELICGFEGSFGELLNNVSKGFFRNSGFFCKEMIIDCGY